MGNDPGKSEQVEALRGQADGLAAWSDGLVVSDQCSADAAVARLSELKGVRKRWVEYWRPIKAAAHDAWKRITAKEREGTDLIDSAERRVKAKVLDWREAERRKAEEQRAKLQAIANEKARREKARLEREAAALKTES